MPDFEKQAAFQRIFCIAALVLGIGFKFWLIQESEIVDDSHDPSEYVLQVLYPVNGGIGYGPGTGTFGRIFYDLGVPYRLGLEAVYVAAALLVLKSLFDWPGQSYLPTFLFLVVLFDPTVVELFSQFWSDEAWLIETMIGIALAILAVRRGQSFQWLYLLAALVLGYTTITRSVFFPLLMALLSFSCLAFAVLLLGQRRDSSPNRPVQLLLALWSLLLGISIVYFGTCTYNDMKFGFYGISAPDSVEYREFYVCLQSVGDPTGDNYFPVDEARRELIARAGPRSRWFMDQLSHDRLDNEGGVTQYRKYDIPSGLFHWAVFHCALSANHGDLQKTFQLFRDIESEIQEAKNRGVLKVRPVLPLPDSRLGVVLKAYPHELAVTIHDVLYEPPPHTIFSGQDPSRYRNPDFTRALHRRTVHNSPLRDRIWNLVAFIYASFYNRFAFCLFLLILAFFVVHLIWKRALLIDCSLEFLLQQLYVILFFCLLGWYSFFGASGVYQNSRYMIFNHVMMPVLTAYYISRMIRLLRKEKL